MESSKGSPENAAQGLARLMNEVLAKPEGRKQFFADPQRSLTDLGLPAEVAEFFGDLSYEELRLLARTWTTMEAADLVYELPGARVSLL
jgi:hypothetical protein